MADSTDGGRRWQWQDGTSVAGHMQAVADTPAERADAAWGDYITHTAEECKGTCRTIGVDCPEAVTLKQAWNTAKRAAQ